MNMLQRVVPALLCLLFVQAAGAASFSERLQNLFGDGKKVPAQEEFLKPDEAFIMQADVTGPDSIHINWQIAEGHYLYHDKFAFNVVEGNAAIDQVGIHIPPGEVKEDPSFGRVEVNYHEVDVNLPVSGAGPDQTVTLEVKYQGCKEDSICYPPITKQVPLIFDLLVPAARAATAEEVSTATPAAKLSEQDSITESLKTGGLLLNIIAFFGFGLLLSLTPCVFPMIPILSGIIVGQGDKITPVYGFLLSLVYILAMAFMYAVLGIIAGSFNINLQAVSQNIWVISAFSLVFVVLALSMFGFYELQLPAAVQSRLTKLSNSQRGGTLQGVAIMGALSAVIVGPCVAPPLAGALLYISQTGNALLGGLALFALGIGLGVPLLVIGGSAGGLLPKAGYWMDTIKRIFGVMMIGVAIWFMDRVLPGIVIMYLWAILLIVSAIYMGALDKLESNAGWARLWKGLGIAGLVYGIALIVGASSGSENLYKPLQGLTLASGGTGAGPAVQENDSLDFKMIKTVDDLQGELIAASQAGKPVMLDFYADWCVVCDEMEAYTFPDPDVRTALKDVVLLKADVTNVDDKDKELMDRFEIFGPPAILFFGNDTRERKPYRLVGFVEAGKFVIHVKEAISS